MDVTLKHRALRISVLLCLFRLRPRLAAEALVVDCSSSNIPASPVSSCNNTNNNHRRHGRRSFLSTAAFGGLTPFFRSNTPAAGAEEDAVRISSSSLLCRPPSEELSKRLSDTRSQIDMAVQASSVQAFSSAAEIVNYPLLEQSSLDVLLVESCGGKNRDDGSGGVVSEILLSVEKMRTTLNSQDRLTTEDAMAVMRYGTTARSGIDSIFGL
mmetsp:Transcript_2785/g.6228  ORF Transcript_2785/g.6228 Transcript_2785/m.6228 type:complete len:212 (+) Transcript_2785:223-858(+)|eukprot:CAMPEP_0201128678 /NCGR_PEP_ID=MMETSP0850-20130426/34442_1 /ASSEMBLY_ACC=CAM_ASM_000622 /TAXON_ID=183588 /ORGANISM="Pseudo-nitzschia fraudulenta, Strain WWA7" /LENGTH=211 /DNA_ID=CAMNT_0047397939 /DNA_START=159 /DNA_END=794 /DNA_ORIENTATION=-